MGRQRKLLEDLAHADGQGRLKAAAEAEAESKAVGYITPLPLLSHESGDCLKLATSILVPSNCLFILCADLRVPQYSVRVTANRSPTRNQLRPIPPKILIKPRIT